MRRCLRLLSVIILIVSLTACSNKGNAVADLPKIYDGDKMLVSGAVLSITLKRYDYSGDTAMLSYLASYEPIATTETTFALDGSITSSNTDHGLPTSEDFSASHNDSFDDRGRLSHRAQHLHIGDKGYTQEWFYEYDDKDDLTKKTYKEAGKDIQWVISYEYLKADDKGNWTLRIETSDYADKNGRDITKVVETRDISYYSE